jgi:hypothetical protein
MERCKVLMVFLLMLTLGCQKKEVMLPTLGITGIQDTIYDNSKIWIFFEVEGSDTIAKLNKNNSIANTHWIFNIDKRLSLKHVIPKIQQLQVKKAKPSMHDNGKLMHSYYSYLDTAAQKLSFVLFDSVKYITDNPLKLEQISKDSIFDHLILDYNKKGVFIAGQKIEMDNLKSQLEKNLNTSKLKIHLSFDKELSYQNYIHLKALLFHLENDSIIIAKEEYIK